jgi:hypothetical protein
MLTFEIRGGTNRGEVIFLSAVQVDATRLSTLLHQSRRSWL